MVICFCVWLLFPYRYFPFNYTWTSDHIQLFLSLPLQYHQFQAQHCKRSCKGFPTEKVSHGLVADPHQEPECFLPQESWKAWVNKESAHMFTPPLAPSVGSNSCSMHSNSRSMGCTPQSKHSTNLGVIFRVPGMQRNGLQAKSAIQIHSGDNVLKGWDNALYGGDMLLLESQGGWCVVDDNYSNKLNSTTGPATICTVLGWIGTWFSRPERSGGRLVLRRLAPRFRLWAELREPLGQTWLSASVIELAIIERAPWWAMMSFSVMPSFQSRTWRNSLYLVHISLAKDAGSESPMFSNVELLPYCENRVSMISGRALRNTRSQAQSSVTIWRCDFVRVM